MGLFITGKSRIEQTDEDGYWKLVDNELYMDNDGKILLCPRRFWTDGYTFPGFVMAILGDKNRFDVRGAHMHDIACRFHQVIQVKLSIQDLRKKGYLKYHEKHKLIYCDDIPIKYLEILSIKKSEADDMLERMMRTSNMKDLVCKIIRFGVRFNLNWYLRCGKRSLATYDIYNEDIGLVNGV